MCNEKVTTNQAAAKWHRRAGMSLIPTSERHRIATVDWKLLDLNSEHAQIAWLGHASFLVVWRKLKILIDPVFSKFVGIVPRRCPIPRGWQTLDPDCIFLSHAHLDHMDVATLGSFKDVPIYLPDRSERFLGKSFTGRCHALRENQIIEMGGLRIQTVHAQHGGWRFPWQKGYRALGYLFSDGKQTVYYSGDTAYGEHFRNIGKSTKVDLALLPIGAYSPQWFLQKRHLNPEEAVTACKDLNASRMIPFHFGGYRLSLEPLDEPFPRFVDLAHKENLDWFLPVGI